jgi:hypothetical protein
LAAAHYKSSQSHGWATTHPSGARERTQLVTTNSNSNVFPCSVYIDDTVKEFYTRRTDVLGDINGSAS